MSEGVVKYNSGSQTNGRCCLRRRSGRQQEEGDESAGQVPAPGQPASSWLAVSFAILLSSPGTHHFRKTCASPRVPCDTKGSRGQHAASCYFKINGVESVLFPRGSVPLMHLDWLQIFTTIGSSRKGKKSSLEPFRIIIRNGH